MKRFVFPFFFLFVLSFRSFGQESRSFLAMDWALAFLESSQTQDFLVLASGEKIFGSVVRNYEYADYEEVKFETEGKVTTYLPGQIQGFGLTNGQIFISKLLPGGSQLVFLQILVSGPLQLGEYKGGYFLDNGKDYEKLEPYLDNVKRDDPVIKRSIRPYKGTFKRFLVGDCGVSLFTEIDRAPYNDRVFVNLLKSYFNCTKGSYQVHIEKIPFIQLSPIVGMAINQHSLSRPIKNEARADGFESPFGFSGFVGVRAHDARRLPRLSTDLRIEFSVFRTQLFSSFNGTQAIRTGSEDLSETAIAIPFALNYSLLKRSKSEIYLGAFLGIWRPSIKQTNGMIDERIISRNEVYLYEQPIMLYQGTNYYSGIRLGGAMVVSDKVKIFAEAEVSMQPEYYKLSLFQNDAFYNRSRLAFHLGLEF